MLRLSLLGLLLILVPDRYACVSSWKGVEVRLGFGKKLSRTNAYFGLASAKSVTIGEGRVM